MAGVVQNIRAKIKRRLSHKEENPNFDDYSSGDEETSKYVSKEAEDAEQGGYDAGKPGTFLNKLIAHGNKKTEDQIARESAPTSSSGGGAASQDIVTGRVKEDDSVVR